MKKNVRHVGEKYKSHGRVGFLALNYSWHNLISCVVPYIKYSSICLFYLFVVLFVALNELFNLSIGYVFSVFIYLFIITNVKN